MIPKLPNGFRAAGVHSGIKSDPNKEDLTLVVSDRPAVGVGVYTKNLVVAAPVVIDRQRTPNVAIRAVVINSGVANACTGQRGEDDARQMAAWVADACGVDHQQALVMSTGVIGEFLPMEKIRAGVQAAAEKLGDDGSDILSAARGMMTTDTVPKVSGRELKIADKTVRVMGMAKGAGMIAPDMATMLGLVLTDAKLSVDDAQSSLVDAVDESFHCISVDGHTSTNDTVVLLANGASDGPQLSGTSLREFRNTLVEVCEELAQAIPADGEGVSHLIAIEVHGCRTRGDALQIGRTIADSPLVKTAIAGNDPNWGRIVSAVGYAGVKFDPTKISLYLNGVLLYEHGTPIDFDAKAVSELIASKRDTSIVLLLEEGTAAARFWTSDLTAEYVRINAEYHT